MDRRVTAYKVMLRREKGVIRNCMFVIFAYSFAGAFDTAYGICTAMSDTDDDYTITGIVEDK